MSIEFIYLQRFTREDAEFVETEAIVEDELVAEAEAEAADIEQATDINVKGFEGVEGL